MKEFLAETGGRYTYTDDILNLQELANSFTSIFSNCSNFIISGCEINGNEINEGFVWINGKIRHYSGNNNVSFPFYIYEKNSIDTITYANDINKKGRINFLCTGGTSLPEALDPVTQNVPGFIEIKESYSPRLADKFFGKYAVLLDAPFSKQTIKKDLVLSGKFTGENNITSKTELSVINKSTGYTLKNILKANGDGSTGLYLNGLLINEVALHTNGTFSLIKDNQILASFTSDGLSVRKIATTSGNIGKYLIEDTIENYIDENDSGGIIVNYSGAKKQGVYYRDFSVYDGKLANNSILKVEGKTKSVLINGYFKTFGDGDIISIGNNTYSSADKKLLGSIQWQDKNNTSYARLGFLTPTDYDLTVNNLIGNISLSPLGYIDLKGEVRLKGTNIYNIFVKKSEFEDTLIYKVDAIEGKQLSTEDFTSEYKRKLDSISTGIIGTNGDGYTTAKEVTEALSKKLNNSSNLSDLTNKSVARANLDIFSKVEINSTFLKISGNLQELVNLSADEINGLTPEEASALKAMKQQTIRDVIDAEKKGMGDLKLSKSLNLSDLPDKDKARKNMGVYSFQQIDDLLSGYLPNSSEYKGVIFTQDHKTKLESISTGNFEGIGIDGLPIPQKDGYVLVSSVLKEFDKKANRLLDDYNDSEKNEIASNIGIYTKSESDTRYASVEELFQDFITYLVKQGKSTTEAQKILRDKLDTPSKKDISENYLKKDLKLSDLTIQDADAKKQVCNKIGAAYAPEYQTKIIDSGWIKMNNSGGNTYASDLYIRQIGNIVSIQGKVYNNKHDGDHWGGTIAVIPNQIQPPKYSIKNSLCEFNDDHKHNRGATYVIWGGDRRLIIYESGWYVSTEINFTYMV